VASASLAEIREHRASMATQGFAAHIPELESPVPWRTRLEVDPQGPAVLLLLFRYILARLL